MIALFSDNDLLEAYENRDWGIVEFQGYFNEFYGTNGIYADEDKKFGKDFDFNEITMLISMVLEKHPGHEFAGDSFDREMACSELLGSNERFLPPGM